MGHHTYPRESLSSEKGPAPAWASGGAKPPGLAPDPQEFGCIGCAGSYNARDRCGRYGGLHREEGGLKVRRTWAIALAGVGAGLGLLGLGLALGDRPDAAAWAARLTEGGGGGEVLLSATPLGADRVVVCLVDTSRERLMVYLADGKRSRLRLLAVRDISADWALSDYNNDAPLPGDIRQRVEKWKESTDKEAGRETRKPPP